MNKVYFCNQINCNNYEQHDNHQTFEQETLETFYDKLFTSNLSLDYEYFLLQIQLLQNVLDKVKHIFLKKVDQQNETFEKLRTNYHSFSTDWKSLAQHLSRDGEEICIELFCVEILLKISKLIKMCEKMQESSDTISKTKFSIKVKLSNQIKQPNLIIQEEQVPNMKIRTKLERLILVGTSQEKIITNLHQYSSDSILIHFEDQCLVNFNLISKCSRQFAINCHQFSYENDKLLVRYQDEFSFYILDNQNKKFCLINHTELQNIVWFQIYGDFTIYQNTLNKFYRLLDSEEFFQLQLEYAQSTKNIIQNDKLIIAQNQRLIIHDLLENQTFKTQFDERILDIKKHCYNYVCIVVLEKLYIYELAKQVIVKLFQIPSNINIIVPSINLPFLFILSSSGNIKQSQVYFHNTSSQLAQLVSQNPTAIFMSNHSVLIGDDLGYLQTFSFKCDYGIQVEN